MKVMSWASWDKN